MPKIIWEGNQDWNRNFKDKQLPAHANKISRPDNIIKSSLPYGILPMLICFSAVIIKKNISNEFIFNLWFMPLGFIIGFIIALPMHEYLHAIFYPKNATVFVGVCLKRIAAYAVSFYPISRKRFIIMSLAPMLLGVIPLLIFIFCPVDHKPLLTVCIIPSFMGLISPSPDYMDVFAVLRQVPKNAKIQASNEGLFWYN